MSLNFSLKMVNSISICEFHLNKVNKREDVCIRDPRMRKATQVKERESGECQKDPSRGSRRVRLSETSSGVLESLPRRGGVARVQRARREAGEGAKGIGWASPCAEGPSLRWRLCPAVPASQGMEATDQG